MEKEFVSYEQAVALKELGFDEPCFGRYIYDGRGKEWFLVQTQQTKNASVIFEGDVSVDGISIASPLKQQTFKWIREKYKYYFWIEPCSQHKFFHFTISCSPSSFEYWTIDESKPNSGALSSYPEAENEMLNKLVELAKKYGIFGEL
jgi:hypothetical protein